MHLIFFSHPFTHCLLRRTAILWRLKNKHLNHPVCHYKFPSITSCSATDSTQCLSLPLLDFGPLAVNLSECQVRRALKWGIFLYGRNSLFERCPQTQQHARQEVRTSGTKTFAGSLRCDFDTLYGRSTSRRMPFPERRSHFLILEAR